MHPVDDQHTTQYLLTRYWEAALGFWRKDARHTAWLLTIAVFSIALLNLGLGLLLNIWNRVMFDGLDNRDMRIVVFQSIIFLPLVLASLAMAIADTYSKMSLQRRWRAWLNGHVLDRWLTSGRYYQLTLRPGEHSTPESRVAEDLRLSVDAPVDIVLGVFAALITLITYIGVLWYIGGEITIPIGTMMLRIPGFLVITAFLYAVLASGAMVKIARGFVPLAESRSQAEADYRYALTRRARERRKHRAARRRCRGARRSRLGVQGRPQALARGDDAVDSDHDRRQHHERSRTDYPAPPLRPQVRGRNDDAWGNDAGRVGVHHRAAFLQLAGRKLPSRGRLDRGGAPTRLVAGFAGWPGLERTAKTRIAKSFDCRLRRERSGCAISR